MLNLIIICLLQPVLTSIPDSGSSGCGCNLNRDGSDKLVKDSTFSSSLNNKYQCEGNFEAENIYNVLDSFNEAEEMSLIPSDEYQLGTDDIAIESDQEGPKRIVRLKSFYIDKYEVSNKDFSIFVNTTLYKTEAEQFGDSFVFSAFLNSTFRDQLVDFRAVQAVWWYKVSGANWLHPFGPDSDISGT